MNAVEIEQAISKLIEQEYDATSFPFAFLEAFGNKETTLKMLRNGKRNASDIDGAVLQRNHIHILSCASDDVTSSLDALHNSAASVKAKAKFLLATDGKEVQAENLKTGETLACDYTDLASHFLFFATLAGISFTKSIENPELDVRATGRLNRLYIELLKHNPSWSTADRRQDMNQFMARIIFSFFAEDTGIFKTENLFTRTIEGLSDSQSTNTHEVIAEIFRAMDIHERDRQHGQFSTWADKFPYVNGGLFAGTRDAPKFSRSARNYLIHAGKLDWQRINPDIFGSMIQAISDEEERRSLGMHYTSVENILKLLNPLFLDDLREKLAHAGNNERKLLNLRKRMAKIRVFDPACGSGNFLVIAYKQMREIENEINQRRGETHLKSEIPLTNFRGIEIRDFPAEIARLALIIAEYQADVLYRGQKDALAEFLPLDAMNWITQGNALRLDWLSICPPTGKSVTLAGDDFFSTPQDKAKIDFENEGGETYICGNPPYLGSQRQSSDQNEDLKRIFDGRTRNWKSLDYVAGWFMKAANYGTYTKATTALVSTNSICQGRQVSTLWPLLFKTGHEVSFAHTSFKWANLASHNAGVTVVIVGIAREPNATRKLFSVNGDDNTVVRETDNINSYLVSGSNVMVKPIPKPLTFVDEMSFGNMPNEGGHLLLNNIEAEEAIENLNVDRKYIRAFVGSLEFIRGHERRCVWISDNQYDDAKQNGWLRDRFEKVYEHRSSSNRATTKFLANTPYRFGETRQAGDETIIIVPRVSSESRPYLPVGLLPKGTIISDSAFTILDAPIWNLAIVASRIHLVWIATVCGKLKTDFRYSNTLGWNTFPVPKLTEKNKADLTKCAEDILLAREAHFPATIADLYKPENMPENLRSAHARNDEVLERIYIGRRFKNDTERLEKLFELYTKMTGNSHAKEH